MSKLQLARPTNAADLLAGVNVLIDELQRRIAFGTGTWTWGGATDNTSVTVVHDLDATPQVVLIAPLAGSLAVPPLFHISAVTSIDFTAYAITADRTVPGGSETENFYWLAIR